MRSLGTATVGGSNDFFKAWGQTEIAKATRLLNIAFDAGVKFFDCVKSYSNSLAETILGQAISRRRDQLLNFTNGFLRPGPDRTM